MATPVMHMGLLGFTPEECERLGGLLEEYSLGARWERWPFIEADALWVNGTHAQVTKDQLVRIPSCEPTRPATLLDLAEIDRPVAFTLPIGAPGLRPAHTFDPALAASVTRVLRKFEAWLQPLAVQLALCQGVADRRHQLDAPVYHVTLGGRLLAVLCARGDAGYAPGIGPSDIAAANWGGRPESAASMPSHFVRTTLPQMMWKFALHTHEDLLPKRYRSSPIYFRAMPAVAQELVGPAHRALLAQLVRGPETFEGLGEQTGLGERALSHALAALYLAGSISCNAKHAAPGSLRGAADKAESRFALFNSSLMEDPQDLQQISTVPAVLDEPRRPEGSA